MARVAATMIAVCATLIYAATVGLAQVPGPASPGRVEERFKPVPKSQTIPEIEIPGPEAPVPSAEAAKIHFTLTAVTFEGNTVFRDAELYPLYQPLLGKDVTLAQLFALRDAVTAKYRAAGYVLSQAIIPPQKIASGVVHIRIVEGYIDHVTVQGDANDDRGLIQETADKVTESRPLDVHKLERYVLLISDIPGLFVRTVIKPSPTTPGAAELVVIVEHASDSVSIEIDNRGSVAIGPEQGQAEVDFNSLFGLDEQTSLLLATTGQPKDLQYGQLSTAWILEPEGTNFKLSGSWSDTKPGGAISLLDAQGHTVTGSGFFDFPFIRSRSENLHERMGFTYLNTTTTLLGTQFSQDRLRYLTFGATYDVADTLLSGYPASNVMDAEVEQGLNLLDASKTGTAGLSRANGHSDFLLFHLEATRTQQLPDNFSFAVSASGQVAASSLLTPVQFGLGGSRFGRGYEPSELTGDDGLAGSVEGRYDVPLDLPFIGSPQAYGFFDVGEVWNLDAMPGSFPSASLSSAGAGLRFTLFDHFNADVGIAKPLTRPIASRGNKDVRPLFNISTSF